MAIKEQDKVFYEELANGDKVINLPITRANNVEGLGRSANTAYGVGDVVYVDNNKKVALKCTQAGTTSSSELNVSTASIGNVITDGSVVWQVCNRTSDVTSVNGKTGDVLVDVGVTSVNNKTGEVTLKESPYDMTDYIVESYRNGTEWYEVYKSGKVRQGGVKAGNTNTSITITLPKTMANTNYYVSANAPLISGYYLPTIGVETRNKGNFIVKFSSVEAAAGNYSFAWVVEGQGA